MNIYPYSNFHELNLDWIIAQIKATNEKLVDYIKLNTIKYSDPLQWDITRQYETNTVVIDEVTGYAYLSMQSVPSGIAITRTDYWLPIFNVFTIYEQIKDGVAYNNKGEKSSLYNIPKDHLVWVDNELYRALKDIVKGDTFTDGNTVKTTVDKELVSAISRIATNEGNISSIDNTVGALSNTVSSMSTALDNVGDIVETISKTVESIGKTTSIYISNIGDDSNDGRSVTTPIATLTRLANIMDQDHGSYYKVYFGAGTYAGGEFRAANMAFLCQGNINLTSDLVLRNGSNLLIGVDDQVSRDQFVVNIGGSGTVNGIYLNGSRLVTNCPLKFHDCTNAIIADCGSYFATHEYNTPITYGANVTNGLEASRSIALGGLYTGTVTTAFKAFGGVITYVFSAGLKATNYRDRADGGIIFAGNMMDDIKPSLDTIKINYTPGSGDMTYTCPKPGYISVSTETANADSSYSGTVTNNRTHTRIGCGGYGYGRGGGEMACRAGDVITINIDANVKIVALEFHPDY